ncbi:antigen like protein [Clarias magur]|uniref:Antigen like protein n=1 Tax=Clarias magur TaxID=1594786 RepID=A0A8J4XAD7_CLAMG|nr:antigen like protein [Clarias magur]
MASDAHVWKLRRGGGNYKRFQNKARHVLRTSQRFHLLKRRKQARREFEISVPTRVQMGVYGESVLLSCTFPVSGSWESDSSVITWQRHLEVVHSFFHGRDQPAYQSARYAGRTSLFHQEMKNGNASLRLDRTTLEDAGEYTCSISTKLGSQRKSFSLKVAAFYPEPRLHISVLNDGHLEVLVTSEGGYPSPSLQWLVGNETDITNNTHTQLMQDQHTHLYSVNSKLNLSGSINSSITFIMKNPELGQEMRRNIDFFSGQGTRFTQLHTAALGRTDGDETPDVLISHLRTLAFPFLSNGGKNKRSVFEKQLWTGRDFLPHRKLTGDSQ